MPPKHKGQSRKTKEASATAPSKKQTKKVTKHAQGPEQHEHDLGATDEEEAGLIGDQAIPTT